jgi:hypothetical protein
MAHIVTGALVITKRENGSDLYLYEGAEVPEFVSKDEVKRLVDLELVEDTSSKKAADKKPAAESN